MPINVNRTTSITLPGEVSGEILQKVQEESAIMRLAQKTPLPGLGVTIPVISGDPEASWVEETGKKPVSTSTLGSKLLRPYTLAVIQPFSNQFRRDAKRLYDALIARMPSALAAKFDGTVIGKYSKPGDDFDTFATCTAQSILPGDNNRGTYAGLVAADTDISTNGGILNGFALSPQARSILLNAMDDNGRPLFVNSAAQGAIPLILGAPTYLNRNLYAAGKAEDSTPATVGVAGDWTKAVYGTVEGVQVSISDQASITMDIDGTPTVVNLWERNMFAVRAEIEIGFRADLTMFDRLVGAVPTT